MKPRMIGGWVGAKGIMNEISSVDSSIPDLHYWWFRPEFNTSVKERLRPIVLMVALILSASRRVYLPLQDSRT